MLKGLIRTPSKGAGLALVSGALAALAHPPFGILPGLLAYGLLFAVVDRTEGAHALRSAAWRGFLAGVAYFSIGCWWVAEAFFVDAAEQGWMAPFAVALLAMLLGAFWAAGALLYRALRPQGPFLKALAFAGALSLLEWMRGHVLTGFPWNLPGETWQAGSAPSQAAALVGAYGLTWLTLAAMASLAAPFAFGRKRGTWGVFAGGLLILGGLYAYGLDRLGGARPSPSAMTVRVVQADVRQDSKYDADKEADIFARYIRLTGQTPADGRAPDIVIWPEGALPWSANDYLKPGVWTYAAIVGALRPGQVLLAGAWRLDEQAARAVYYNSLFAVRRAGDDLQTLGVYDKYRLVPFGEYMPMDKAMGAIGFKKLAHVGGDGFTPGPRPQPLATLALPRVQPLICYESLFPGFVREGAQASGLRARWIVNVSNDAWFGQTSGPWQHLNLASYRAIEEGLPIVRATPTGVSAVIDPYGRRLPGKLLPLGALGVIDSPLPAPLAPTPFGQYGDTGFWIMIGLSIVALVPGLHGSDRGRPAAACSI